MCEVKKRKKEDPEKVYARQKKYKEKINRIDLTPVSDENKENYKKFRDKMKFTHDQALSFLLNLARNEIDF